MADDPKQALAEAIQRNAGAVLSLPSAGMLRHYKTRFLAECEEGIWLEGVPTERPLIDSLISSQQLCGLSFKAGAVKMALTVPILKRVFEYRINAEQSVEAVLVQTGSVRSVQRRSNYRVRVTPDDELAIRVWRIPEKAVLRDRPNSTAELDVKLRDLSIGGAGLAVEGEKGAKPKVLPNERLRIILSHRGEELLLEGRMLSLRPIPGRVDLIHAGVQFKNTESDLEGRQILHELTKIVGQLQREEVRRNRLGIKSA